MFHVRVSQCVAFAVVFLALMHSCRGQNPVIGPSEPVVALVGEDIELPCHLNPAMNAFEMTLEWARPDLDPRFVFVWRDGVELKSKKHPFYEGRTSLFTDELKNGNISMILSKVRLSDEGVYKCLLPDYGESKVQLVVGVVSTPVIEVVSNNSREVVLRCEAKGWYPEPEVFWLDGEGKLLSAGPPETVRGPDDLYTVSRRLTVERSDYFTCRVQQKNINQTREAHLPVFLPVPYDVIVVPSTSNQHVVIGSILGCAALMVILAAVFVLWKRKQRKSKNKMTSPEDGDEQTEEGKTVTSKSESTESVPLMAAREEKNNEDNRGEESKSQSEHKDAEFVMERETHQDQLRTKPEAVTCTQNMDVTEGEKIMTSMNHEEATLIPTQGETQRHQNQDNLSGKQVEKDQDKSEGEKTIKPVKEVSGLPVVLVHTDQEVQREEETQQEQPMEERQPVNGVDKEEVETRKEKAEQKRSGWKEQQRERMKQKTERQKMENKRKRELELERKRQGVKDETEVEPQRDGDRHLLEDKTEKREAEHEEDKGDDQGGIYIDIEKTQRKITRRKKQREQTKELHVSQQQPARRKTRQRKNRAQKQWEIKEYLKEQRDLQMEVKKTYYTQQQVIHEPLRMDLDSEHFCQEDQEEEEDEEL